MKQLNLNDIPYEVYLEYIIEYIGLKEVGTLSIVSKTLKEVFDNNEIWKYLYMKTTSPKILDTSIHIGEQRKTKIFQKNDMLKKLPIYWNYYNNINQDGYSFRYACNCCSDDIAPYIKPLSKVIMNHPEYLNPQFTSIVNHHTYLYIRINKQVKPIQQFYYNYIKNIHIKYNKDNGLSTTNLCQNTKHYDINTLGNIGNNMNWKSYKIQTLKKINTDKRKKVNGCEYRLKIKQIALKKMEKELIQIKKDEIEFKLNLKKNNGFILKSKITLDIINKPKKKKHKKHKKKKPKKNKFKKKKLEII